MSIEDVEIRWEQYRAQKERVRREIRGPIDPEESYTAYRRRHYGDKTAALPTAAADRWFN